MKHYKDYTDLSYLKIQAIADLLSMKFSISIYEKKVRQVLNCLSVEPSHAQEIGRLFGFEIPFLLSLNHGSM